MISEVSFVSEVSVIRIFGTVRLTVYIRCFVGVVSRNYESYIHGFKTYHYIQSDQQQLIRAIHVRAGAVWGWLHASEA